MHLSYTAFFSVPDLSGYQYLDLNPARLSWKSINGCWLRPPMIWSHGIGTVSAYMCVCVCVLFPHKDSLLAQSHLRSHLRLVTLYHCCRLAIFTSILTLMTQSQKYALFFPPSVVPMFLAGSCLCYPSCQKRSTTWTLEQKKQLRRTFSPSSLSIEKQIPQITTVEQIRPRFCFDPAIIKKGKVGP